MSDNREHVCVNTCLDVLVQDVLALQVDERLQDLLQVPQRHLDAEATVRVHVLLQGPSCVRRWKLNCFLQFRSRACFPGNCRPSSAVAGNILKDEDNVKSGSVSEDKAMQQPSWILGDCLHGLLQGSSCVRRRKSECVFENQIGFLATARVHYLLL